MGFVKDVAEGIGNAAGEVAQVASNVTDVIPGGDFLANAIPGMSLFQNIGNIGQILSNPAEALKLGASLAFPGAGPLMNTLMPMAQNMLNGDFDFGQIASTLAGPGGPFGNLQVGIPDFVRQGAQMLTSSNTLMDAMGLLGGADGLQNPMQALAATLGAAGINPIELLLGEQAGQIGQGIANLGQTASLQQILQILAPVLGGAGGAQTMPLIAPQPRPVPQNLGVTQDA